MQLLHLIDNLYEWACKTVIQVFVRIQLILPGVSQICMFVFVYILLAMQSKLNFRIRDRTWLFQRQSGFIMTVFRMLLLIYYDD